MSLIKKYMAKIKTKDEVKDEVKEVVKAVKLESKDEAHLKRLARLNPEFDPEIPEQKQRHFRK
jgi:hypothetical protein